MTAADFTAFYPQFASFTPALVLSSFIDQANARFSDFGEDAEEARRLYTAHKLTLYDFTALPPSPSSTAPSAADRARAGKGQSETQVSSKKVGEVQVNYTRTSLSSSGASASTSLADLTETVYGLQLLTLLRLHGFTRYMP